MSEVNFGVAVNCYGKEFEVEEFLPLHSFETTDIRGREAALEAGNLPGFTCYLLESGAPYFELQVALIDFLDEHYMDLLDARTRYGATDMSFDFIFASETYVTLDPRIVKLAGSLDASISLMWYSQ